MIENNISELSREATSIQPPQASEEVNYISLFNTFFDFQEYPFNNTPDPTFFYTSDRHQEALMNLSFGVRQRKGFIVLTGEIGAGKTTLCRQFLHELSPEIKTAVILNPKISSTHLLSSVIQDFGIPCRGRSKRDIYEAMSKFLLDGMEHNQNACLIIDEAQCLNDKVLEEIRLLSNLETPKQKLFQIILMGQPELKETLRKPSLKQLRQRIGVHVHLSGLDPQEVGEYIQFRLKRATGGEPMVSFDTEVISRIHEQTRGIPRLINTVCDRILMSAYTKQTKHITLGIAQPAFDELTIICEF